MKRITKGTMLAAVAGASLGGWAASHALSPLPIKTFSLRYEWRNGTVPPPYHYEYAVTLRPDGRGAMSLQPGYSGGDTPTWTVAFKTTAAQRKKLLATLQSRGVFTRAWTRDTNPPIGGGSENLEVRAGGRTFTIPAFTAGEARQRDAAAIYAAVNALVPARVRAALEARRAAYNKRQPG